MSHSGCSTAQALLSLAVCPVQPISMHIVQKQIPRWSTKWILLQALSMFSLLITIGGLVGAIAGIVEGGWGAWPLQQSLAQPTALSQQHCWPSFAAPLQLHHPLCRLVGQLSAHDAPLRYCVPQTPRTTSSGKRPPLLCCSCVLLLLVSCL